MCKQFRQKAPLCKEDSPIRGNVVEDDKRVAKLAAKLTEWWKPISTPTVIKIPPPPSSMVPSSSEEVKTRSFNILN